jgi:hypothetical protein
LICAKIWEGGGYCLLQSQDEEEEMGEGEGYSPGHRLNIIDNITDGFHRRINSIGHFVCINDKSLYILAFFNIFFSL